VYDISAASNAASISVSDETGSLDSIPPQVFDCISMASIAVSVYASNCTSTSN
jgi:hypothetical protein